MRAVSVAEGEVDDAEDGRGEDDPEELVPVEEGEAEERRVGMGIEAGEAQREIGEDKKREEPAASVGWGGGRGFCGRNVGILRCAQNDTSRRLRLSYMVSSEG